MEKALLDPWVDDFTGQTVTWTGPDGEPKEGRVLGYQTHNPGVAVVLARASCSYVHVRELSLR